MPARADRLTADQASALLEAFIRYPVQETTLALVRAAIETSKKHQLSYWDACVVEAARALASYTVLTEDLTHGASYNGVTVANPFLV